MATTFGRGVEMHSPTGLLLFLLLINQSFNQSLFVSGKKNHII